MRPDDPPAATTLDVNGQQVRVHVDPEAPLLQVLRNDLGLKGVRPGCGIGVCGACVVLADGEAIRSCSTPLEAVSGRAITTPEGLGTPSDPHPLQAAFIAEQAAQCGYCINGIIMSAAAAAERGEAVDDAPVPAWLDEHLCRCGTHHRILRALRRGTSADGDSPPAGDAPLAREASAGTPEHATVPSAALVESWLRLLPDGRIEARPGKVELGQGIRTAMAQIAAAQIGVPVGCVVVPPAATGVAPDATYTAGSNSVDEGGSALAAAAVAFRRLALARAAELLGTSADRLSFQGDRIVAGNGESVSLARLAATGPITGTVDAGDQPDWRREPLGESVPRDDIPHKVTGAAAFVGDLALPGTLHARALLPPSSRATLDGLDVTGVRDLPGVVEVVSDDRLIIVIAEREEQAVRGVARLAQTADWIVPETGIDSANLFDAMRAQEPVQYVARRTPSGDVPHGASHDATYTQPYQAHAAIAPSCAVAHDTGATLRVWTHSQGVYPLQRALAELLGRDLAAVEVLHRDGPGCYGHNLADDAAAFAAVAAGTVPGRPVRFQFSVTDEFGWEPLGPAMAADLAAVLGADGRVRHWRHRALTDTHTTRPDGLASRLVPAWLRSDRVEFAWPGPHEGGGRNAGPLYDFPAVEAVADHVRGPLRTGSLRTLGAYLNTFAAESFMDELAERAGADALEFRLTHLGDERARRVLQTAAEHAGWSPHVGPSGRGLGLAVSRYKSTKAYVAQAIQAAVDPDSARVTVERLVLVCDAGTVINPDGARNQLEGGALQGLSRALYEEVRFDRRGVASRDWLAYPVLGFSDIPQIEVVLVEAGDHPPLGVGEAALGPAAAALGNAVDDAIGVRLRDLPFTPARIRQRLYDLDDVEAARVLT